MHSVADAACMHDIGEGGGRRKMRLHQVRATRALRLRWAMAKRTMTLSTAPRGAAGAVGVAGAAAEAGDRMQTPSSTMAGQTLPTREHRCITMLSKALSGVLHGSVTLQYE